MPYILTCECGQQMKVMDAHIGKTGRCISCGRSIRITRDRLTPVSATSTSAQPEGPRKAGLRSAGLLATLALVLLALLLLWLSVPSWLVYFNSENGTIRDRLLAMGSGLLAMGSALLANVLSFRGALRQYAESPRHLLNEGIKEARESFVICLVLVFISFCAAWAVTFAGNQIAVRMRILYWGPYVGGVYFWLAALGGAMEVSTTMRDTIDKKRASVADLGRDVFLNVVLGSALFSERDVETYLAESPVPEKHRELKDLMQSLYARYQAYCEQEGYPCHLPSDFEQAVKRRQIENFIRQQPKSAFRADFYCRTLFDRFVKEAPSVAASCDRHQFDAIAKKMREYKLADEIEKWRRSSEMMREYERRLEQQRAEKQWRRLEEQRQAKSDRMTPEERRWHEQNVRELQDKHWQRWHERDWW